MSPFEIVMLICFGVAWPLSIFRMLKTKEAAGKSMLFLGVIITGYLAGILHKVYFNFDNVIYLYGLNLIMVLVDMGLVVHYRRQQQAVC